MAEIALGRSSDETQRMELIEARARWAPSSDLLHPVVQGRPLRLAWAVLEGCEVKGNLFAGPDRGVFPRFRAITFPRFLAVVFPRLKHRARLTRRDRSGQILIEERIAQPLATEILGECRNALHSARPDLLEQG